MNSILTDLVKALTMAEGLSLFSAIPIYVIAYGVACLVVIAAIKKIKEIFNKK